MSFILKINNTVISAADVLNVSDALLEANAGDNLIADTIQIKLSNMSGDYDPRESGSLFYNADFYGWPVEYYDSAENLYLFKGKLRNIETTERDIILNCTNYKQDLANITAVYDNSGETETPAEVIYNLLTSADNGNISADDILYKGFQEAISIQSAAGVYVAICYTKEDGKSVLDVINELRRITQCEIYSKNNHIGLYQWQAWAGEVGAEITSSDLLAGSYRDYFDDANVYNDYNVAYVSGGVVSSVAGSVTSTFEKKSFLVPPDDISADSAADYKIILTSSAAATWCGSLAMTRRQYLKKKFDLSLTYKYLFLELFDICRLNFSPFINEPVQVMKIAKDESKGEIKISGEFLNVPHEYYSRDETPPAKVELVSVLPMGDGGISVKWSKCTAADIAGYLIYITTTKGEWTGEKFSGGVSPVDVKSPSQAADGNLYKSIYQFNSGTKYYFKVVAYDSSFNKSAESNVLSCYAYTSGYLNQYYLQGFFCDKLALDIANAAAGAVLSDPPADVYPADLPATVNYCAAYESGLLFNNEGFSYIAIQGTNKIYFQYRAYSSGAFGSWTIPEAVMTGAKVISGNYIQYRLLFASENWSDSDYCYVREII